MTGYIDNRDIDLPKATQIIRTQDLNFHLPPELRSSAEVMQLVRLLCACLSPSPHCGLPEAKEPLSFQVPAQILKVIKQAFGDCHLYHAAPHVSRVARFPGRFTRM